MKLSMLAQPPNPNPTTKTHPTTNMFTEYSPAQPPNNDGALSTAFCIIQYRKKKGGLKSWEKLNLWIGSKGDYEPLWLMVKQMWPCELKQVLCRRWSWQEGIRLSSWSVRRRGKWLPKTISVSLQVVGRELSWLSSLSHALLWISPTQSREVCRQTQMLWTVESTINAPKCYIAKRHNLNS